MLSSVDAITAAAQSAARTRNSGQVSLFGADSATPDAPLIPLQGPDATRTEKSTWERDLLGAALSYNPLTDLPTADTGDAITTMAQLGEELADQRLEVAGIVATVTERARRDGQRFLAVDLDMLGGRLEVMVWPEALAHTAGLWKTGAMLRIHGLLRNRADQLSLNCETASHIEHPEAPGDNSDTGDQNHDAPPSDPTPRSLNPPPPAQTQPQPRPDPAPDEPPQEARYVQLTLTDTADPQLDTSTLRETVSVMLEHPRQGPHTPLRQVPRPHHAHGAANHHNRLLQPGPSEAGGATGGEHRHAAHPGHRTGPRHSNQLKEPTAWTPTEHPTPPS